MRSFLFLTAVLSFTHALTISTTGSCGKQAGLTCKGSTFGNCCSQHGYCGSSSAYCGSGCQTSYGACTNSAPPVSPVTVSNDGSCGGRKGFTCLNSEFGHCCSQYGYCGSTQAYCGSGCNPQFGTCSGTGASSSSKPPASTASHTAPISAPSSTFKVSENARCGKGFEGFTCAGSRYGNCCSQYSYCGSTDAYCGEGCQAGFGTCGKLQQGSSESAVSTSSSADSSSESTSSTSTTAEPLATFFSSTSEKYSSSTSETSTPEISSSSSTLETTSSTSSETSTTASSEPLITTTTTLVSSTAGPSSTTPKCSPIAPIPTNVVPDGGFEESSRRLTWSMLTTGSWGSSLPRPASPGYDGDAHSGRILFYGSTFNTLANSVEIYKDDISIPSGTLVECSAWFAVPYNTGRIVRLEILIDGQVCAEALLTENKNIHREPYFEVKSQLTVSGDRHKVAIRMSNTEGSGAVMYKVDDVSVVAIEGPPCSILTSTSSETSVDPTSTSLLSSSSITEPASTTTSSVTDSSSTTSESSTSSAMAEASSTSVEASSTSIEASSTIAAPPACTPTNYLGQPDFENPDISNSAPWSWGVSGQWEWPRIKKTNVEDAVFSGQYAFVAETSGTGAANMFLEQSNLRIPDGTQVVASMFVKILRPADNVVGGVTLSLGIAMGANAAVNQLVQVVPNPERGEYNRWIQLMSEPFIVEGPRQMFRLAISTNGYRGRILAVDDFELVSLCSAST